jgi:hypothetical protein
VSPRQPRVTPELIARYRREAEHLRREAFREVFTWLATQAIMLMRYAVAAAAAGLPRRLVK